MRQALSGLADGVSIPERPLADLKQIATEACMNAVVHAYPGRDDGRIDVSAIADERRGRASNPRLGRRLQAPPGLRATARFTSACR